MKLRNEISDKERFLSPMCAICDEYAFARLDGFCYSGNLGSAPLYCADCLTNWTAYESCRNGKLQIGKEEEF
jgi:hypothetical protein